MELEQYIKMQHFQAEIDAACELIDFLRFNSFFGKELLKYQPISEQPQTTLNLMRYRSLEGFVASGKFSLVCITICFAEYTLII